MISGYKITLGHWEQKVTHGHWAKNDPWSLIDKLPMVTGYKSPMVTVYKLTQCPYDK